MNDNFIVRHNLSLKSNIMNLLNLGLNILAGNVVALIMNNGDVKRGEFLGVMPDDMIVLCSEVSEGIIALCEIQREDVRWIYRF